MNTIPKSEPSEIETRTVTIEPIEKLKQAYRMLGDQYWLFVGMCLVAMFIGGAIPFGILMGPMMCGLFMCYRKRADGEQASFELLFKGFDHFVESLIATLVMMGVSLLVFLPVVVLFFVVFIAGAATENEGIMISGMLLLYLLIFVISIMIYVPFVFTYELVAERNLREFDAVKHWTTNNYLEPLNPILNFDPRFLRM